jgi:hypothetical protein
MAIGAPQKMLALRTFHAFMTGIGEGLELDFDGIVSG